MSARGRYAPSPTGRLHLGNASTALVAWLASRAKGAPFVLRVEDLDLPRVQAGSEEAILDDLRWLGLDWDEGPDVGGPFPTYRQSERFDAYDAAFETLRAEGRVYPCFCSRKDVARAAAAPQESGDAVRYPGTCRELARDEAFARVARGEAHAWRMRVSPDARPGFDDAVHGACRDERAPGDFVVRRRDGVASYQLAVVVDDAAMEIGLVVRGDDLLDSTARQLVLFDALGAAPPTFAHVPLWLGDDGVRLSKRHRGTAIRDLRDRGVAATRVVGAIARRLGLVDRAESVAARDLVEGFRLDRIATGPIRLGPDDPLSIP